MPVSLTEESPLSNFTLSPKYIVLIRSPSVFFCRSRGGVPVLLDEEEKEARLQKRASIARAFKVQREEVVEKRREQDRLDRNAAKERQLQEAEELQVQPVARNCPTFRSTNLSNECRVRLNRSAESHTPILVHPHGALTHYRYHLLLYIGLKAYSLPCGSLFVLDTRRSFVLV